MGFDESIKENILKISNDADKFILKALAKAFNYTILVKFIPVSND